MKSWNDYFSVQDEVVRPDVVASPLKRDDLLIGGRSYLRADYPGMSNYPNKLNLGTRTYSYELTVSDEEDRNLIYPIKKGTELLRVRRLPRSGNGRMQLHHYDGQDWTTLIVASGTLANINEPRICYNEERGLAFIWYASTRSDTIQAHWITEPNLAPTKYDSDQNGSIDGAIRTAIYNPYGGKTVMGACFNKAGTILYIFSPHHGIMKVTQDGNGDWVNVENLVGVLANGLYKNNNEPVGMEVVEDVPEDDPAYGNIILSSANCLIVCTKDGDIVYEGIRYANQSSAFYDFTSDTQYAGYERVLVKNKLIVTRNRMSIDGGASWEYLDLQHSNLQALTRRAPYSTGIGNLSTYRQHVPMFMYDKDGNIISIGDNYLYTDRLTAHQIMEDGTVRERGIFNPFVGKSTYLNAPVGGDDYGEDIAYIFTTHCLDKQGGMCIRAVLDNDSLDKSVYVYAPLADDPSQFYVPKVSGITDFMGNSIVQTKVIE